MKNRRNIETLTTHFTALIFSISVLFAGGVDAQSIKSKAGNDLNIGKFKTASWAARHTPKPKTKFADHYVYYDANRKGYVFWENGKWSFTPTMPPVPEMDLHRTEIKLTEDFSLDLYPQRSYPRMMKLYPPDPNNNLIVAVPTPLQWKP